MKNVEIDCVLHGHPFAGFYFQGILARPALARFLSLLCMGSNPGALPAQRRFLVPQCGLVLRDDQKENIYLAVSSWLVYNVFSFDPSAGGGWGWETLLGNWTKGGLVAGRGVNSVEVLMQNSALSITINGNFSRIVNLPGGSGQVGLYVSNWETGAGFDNFHFEELP